MIRALLPSSLLVLTAGCLLGDVSGIPCTVDDECPSDSFCDLPGGVCITTAAEGMPPDVQILGVEGEDGEPHKFSNVVADVKTTVTLHLKNEGGYVAEDLEIELSELSCAPASVTDAPSRLDPGAVKKATLTVFVERDCANPVPVDWFTRFSGREHRGVFELFHESTTGEEYD